MALCLHQYNYNCVHHSNCGESPVNIIMMSSHYTEWYEELFLRLHQQKITLTCNCSIWPFLVWMSSIAEASGQGKQTHPCQVLRSSGKDGATDSVWREEHEWLSACTKASLCCFSSSPLTNTPITSNINSKIIGLCCTLINLSDQQTSKYSFHSLLLLVTSDMSFLNIGTCFWSRWTPHHSCVCVTIMMVGCGDKHFSYALKPVHSLTIQGH